MIAASIVSHGHGAMVCGLTEDLLGCPEVTRVIITQNIPEQTEYPRDTRVEIVRNSKPHGYGANHNAGFAMCWEFIIAK